MRHPDAAGLIHLDLPSGWALDPLSSSLFERVFVPWAATEPHRLFVRMFPTVTRGAHDDWVRRTIATLPEEVPHHEVSLSSRGPVVWVVRPGREGRPNQRWALVRGRSADVALEEVGVLLGGPVRTPTRREAVASLQVPVNDDQWKRPPGSWNELMDEADAAAEAGEDAQLIDRLLAAHDWALRSWLQSVQEGVAVSRFLLAATQSRVSLASAARDLRSLAMAVEVTHRLTSFADDEAEGLERLRARLFAVCGDAAKQPAPHDTWQAFRLVTGLVVDQVLGAADTPADTPGDAARRRDDAETAMRLTASSLLVGRLLHSSRSESSQAIDRLEDQSLSHLVAAGAAYQAALWGTAQKSSSGVAAEWLAACRLFAARHPSDQGIKRILVSALLSAAGACMRVGGPESVAQEEDLLAEARAAVGEQPEDPMHDRVWLLSAWASMHARRPNDALARADRMVAAAPDVARSRAAVKAAAYRLLSRHDDELEQARRAVADDDPSDSTHRGALALALASAGRADEAAAEALRALRSAVAENPLGEPVVLVLSMLAQMMEDTDPPASLRLTALVEELLDLQATTLDSPGEAVSFGEVEHHREVVADLVVRLLEAGEPDEALAIAEYARARTARPGFRTAGDRPSPPLGAPSDASLAQLATRLREYVGHRREERGLPPRLDGGALRALVGASGRPALLMHPSASGLVRFLLMPDGSGHVDLLHGERDEIARRIVQLHADLGFELTAVARGESGTSPDDAALIAALEAWAARPAPKSVARNEDARRSLHDLLVGELGLPAGPVALVPFRELALVPYPALLNHDGSALVDNHDLSLLPSLTSLASLPSRPPRKRRAVVVGAPNHDQSLGLPRLTHAAEEAMQVGRVLAGVAEVAPPLLRADADELSLRRVAPGAGILHLACHASVGATPADSALYLTPAAHDDGALRLDEVEDLLLDDALVVLAACQTGLGRATPDGVAGLGQGFLRGGARCVVLSLWRVGDASTSMLMGHFYRLLVGGPDRSPLDVATALAGAQRLIREQFPHVAQWGPWLVTGDGGWRLEP